MATQPNIDDIDLTQLDLADPETRKFAEGRVDLSDPETKKWWDSSNPVRSASTRFGDLVSKAAVSGPFGTMTVYAQDWMDSGKNLLKEKFPGKSDEWYEDRTDRLLAENYKATVQEYEDKGKNDPYWKAEDSFLNNLGRAGLTIGGTIAGSGSPIDLVAPGASRIGKVAWQGALNAGEEAVNQVAQIGKELRNTFNTGEVVMAGVTGTALPALFETTGFVKDLFKGRGVDTTPGADPRMTDEVEEGLKDLYKTGTFEEIADYQIKHGFTTDLGELGEFVRQRDEGAAVSDAVLYADQLKKEAEDFQNRPQPEPTPLEQEAAAFKSKPEPTVEDVFPTDESLAAKSKAMEEKLQAEATAFQNRNTPDPVEAKPVEAEAPITMSEAKPFTGTDKAVDVEDDLPQNVKDIVDHTDELTAKWQNSPDVVVYDHFDDFDELDPGSLGVYNPEDGKVYLNANAIDKEAAYRGLTQKEMTNTVLFHEGLGHFGLAQKFRDDLDDTLSGFYENSPYFRKQVDAWIKKNPNSYKDEDTIVRAGEEILAEMSEAGRMPATFINKIKNQIKDYARDLGIKLDFSEREIRTILAQAHEAVISGKGADVRGNGYRSMKSTFGESKGPLQGPASKEDAEPSTINKFRSNRNIEDIMEEAAPTKTKETWEEWIDSADRTKMTGKIAASLAKGVEVPELLAAQQFAVKSANRIYDLSRKAANGTATEREMALLGKEMERLEDVSEAITNVVTNAARILNSRKIEVGSDKALADQIRRMLATADLSTPAGVEAVAKKIVQDQKKARLLHKALNVLGNIVNLPFTMLSSYDLSAPLRQGRTQIHTKEFWQGIAPMFKMAFSENTFQKTMDEIKARPNYKLMERAGLALTDLGDDLTNREDRFLSKWAEKLPGVRGSARAYTGFLNKLRADTFDSLVKSQADAGINIDKNPDALKEVAGFINNATGRGNLGKLSQAAPILTGVFFSPRLIASRVAMLNPAYYAKLSPPVRKEALKSLLSLGTTTATLAGLFAMAGADVETDPRSSDFMKIKTGNTRYDIMGGFGQYLTLGARLATNEKKDSKGDIVELGKKFGSNTRWDTTLDFLSNKFSPVAGFVKDYLKGKDATGEEFKAETAILKMFIPLFVQDTYDLMKERGVVEGAVRSVPGIFGAGASTYPGPKGFDEYGRAYDSDREDDPVVSEVKRLQEMTPDETFLNPVRGTVTIDGEKVKLPDDILYEYQKLAGENVMSDLKVEIEDTGWNDYTDEEKIEIIKDITRDARKDARAELFGDMEEGELDDTKD